MSARFAGWRSLLGDVVVYSAAFGTTSVISYVYVVLAGRMLGDREFGVFNAMLGIITLAGVVANSLQIAATQVAARCPTRIVLSAMMDRALRCALPAVAVVTAVAMPFAGAIGADAAQVALCGGIVMAMMLGCSALGFLAGAGRIRGQAGVNLAGAVTRLGAGWPLILAGLGVSGAIAGYLVNYVVVLLLASWMGWQIAARTGAHAEAEPTLRLQVAGMATFVLAFAPFTLDQFLVQVFAPSAGGDYAAAATMGKVVFFSAYPVIIVAYPHLLKQASPRIRMQLLIAAAAAALCIAACLAWVLAAFPVSVATFFFGGRFSGAVSHVGAMACGVAAFTASALGAHALIAWGNRLGFLPSLVALVFGVALFSVRHDTLATVVENQVWIYGLQAFCVLALLAVTVRNSLRRAQSTGHRGWTAE